MGGHRVIAVGGIEPSRQAIDGPRGIQRLTDIARRAAGLRRAPADFRPEPLRGVLIVAAQRMNLRPAGADPALENSGRGLAAIGSAGLGPVDVVRGAGAGPRHHAVVEPPRQGGGGEFLGLCHAQVVRPLRGARGRASTDSPTGT